MLDRFPVGKRSMAWFHAPVAPPASPARALAKRALMRRRVGRRSWNEQPFAATMDLEQVLSWQISWDFITNIFGLHRVFYGIKLSCLNRIYHINITGFWNPSTVIYKIYVFPTNEPRQMSVKHPLALNFAPQQGPQHREQVNLRPQNLTKNTCIYIYV